MEFIDNNYDCVEGQEDLLVETIENITNKGKENIIVFDDNSDTYCFKDPFYKIFAGMFLKEKNISSKKMTIRDMESLINKAFLSMKLKYDNSDMASIDSSSNSSDRNTRWNPTDVTDEDIDRVSDKHDLSKNKYKEYLKKKYNQ